jgi:hypothetical protein
VKVFWTILFTVLFVLVSRRTHETSMNTGDRVTPASWVSLGLSSTPEFVDIPGEVAQSGEGVWRPAGCSWTPHLSRGRSKLTYIS